MISSFKKFVFRSKYVDMVGELERYFLFLREKEDDVATISQFNNYTLGRDQFQIFQNGTLLRRRHQTHICT